MYIPSDAYLKASKKYSRTPKTKIVIDGIEYTGMDVIKSHPSISHEASKMIGEFPTKQCKITIFNRENNIDVVNKEISVYRGLVLEDNSIEYIPQGIFIPPPDSIKSNSTAKTIEITMKDKSVVFDNPYGGLDNIVYPTTLGFFINEIIERRGLILETPEFPFYDLVLETRPNFDLNSTTERQLIASAGALGGCNTQMSRLGGVRIERNVKTDIQILRKSYKSLSSKEKMFGPINSVVLGNTGMNNDVVKKDEESILANGLFDWKLYDNPFVDLNKAEMIDSIASQILGMYIVPFEITDAVDSYLYDIGDQIEVQDKQGNIFSTTILKIASSARIYTKLAAAVQQNSQTNYNLAGSSKKSLESIKLDVDHVKNELTAQATKITEQSEKYTSLELDVNGIKETVSSTETNVKELAESISYFNVDLSQYTMTIPADSNKLPLDTASYVVDFYAYFKGKQVMPSVELNDSNVGITTQIDDSRIIFSIDKNVTIDNISNNYNVIFNYNSDGSTYSVTKQINLTLSTAGAQGIPGQQGPPGEDGTSSYFYIRYSTFSDGRDMTATPTETTEYLGVSNTTSPTPPTTPSAYIWSKIKGDQGIQGIQGQQGVAGSNGLNSYLHIKWSEDGENFSANEGKIVARWQGTYVDNSEVDSNIFDDYNWIDTAIVVSDELNDIREQTDSIQENLNNNYSTKEEIDSQLNDNKSSIDTLKSQIVELQQTALDFSVSISSIIQNGVNKVVTETGFVFDKDGLNISKTGEEMKNLVNNKGIYVSRDGEEVLGADNMGVRTENVAVRKYLVIGKNSRMEDYMENQTGVFYIGEGDE